MQHRHGQINGALDVLLQDLEISLEEPQTAVARLRQTLVGLVDAAPAGRTEFEWDGTTDTGEPAGDGPFTIRVAARSANGDAVTAKPLVWAPVTAVAMGSDGMRASLPSRETIADSIELAVSGHCLDAMVLLVGCDNVGRAFDPDVEPPEPPPGSTFSAVQVVPVGGDGTLSGVLTAACACWGCGWASCRGPARQRPPRWPNPRPAGCSDPVDGS